MILITGGLGFIGLHAAKAFLDVGESVVLTRYRSASVPDFLQPELGKRVFIEAIDLNSPYTILDAIKKYKVSAICDLFVPRRGTLPAGEDYRVKTQGLLHVLEAARLGEVEHLAHASSVAVYSSVSDGPFREDMPLPLDSRNETEAFKKAQEVLVNHYANETGMDVVFLRIGNFRGPLYQRGNRPDTRMLVAALTGQPANWDGVPGGPVHAEDHVDFTYVKDGARAIQMLTMARKLPSRAYNISAGATVSFQEFANAVKKVYPNTQIDFMPGRSSHARPEWPMDVSLLKRDTGWQPEYDVYSGAAEWLDWLKTHKDF